jgi:hypothetical protein
MRVYLYLPTYLPTYNLFITTFRYYLHITYQARYLIGYYVGFMLLGKYLNTNQGS